MAVTRTLCRMAPRRTSVLNTSVTRNRFVLRNTPHQHHHRTYTTQPSSSSSSSSTSFLIGIGVGSLLAGGGVYFLAQQSASVPQPQAVVEKIKAVINTSSHQPKPQDYQAVYNAVAARLEEKDEYDDGSYGPVLVRLAWHCSGTYDADTKTGGSNGATMRFDPEGDHGANSGLNQARLFLEPVKGECISSRSRPLS